MISTCIITNRLDGKLARAIQSVAGLGDVIIVDTVGVHRGLYLPQASIYTYPWQDDFSSARNFALEKAKGKFILSLDADEWIDPDGKRIFAWLDRHEAPNKAFATRLVDNGIYRFDQVKLFPNRSDVRYYGRVHEQITFALARAGIPVVHSGINIYHDGYVNKEELQAKRQRNRRIVFDWLQDEPHNKIARYWYDFIYRCQ